MAEQTITSLTINTLLIGIVMLGLISSYVLLVNNEGRSEIFDEYPEIEAYKLNVSSIYTDGQLMETANVNSNLSANYNPEFSQSGADQSGNAISVNLQNIVTITFTTIGLLGSMLFGNVYTSIISTILFSVLGYIIVAYTIKAIRTGQT
jgi:hypothetical protein